MSPCSKEPRPRAGDPDSMLALYRRLMDLRRDEAALSGGDYVPRTTNGDVIAYLRKNGDRRMLVALYLGHDGQYFALDELAGRIVMTTHLDREGEAITGRLRLRPDETVVAEIDVHEA